MTARRQLLLCLITGPSGSGKTSIASELEKLLTKNICTAHQENLPLSEDNSGNGDVGRTAVVLLHQDHYFSKTFLPYNERKDDSYENNSGIDWDRLILDIQWHASKHPASIIIVEGHLLGDASAMFQNIALSFDILSFLTTCSMETCRHRRLERRFRSDYERHELANYFNTIVWPSFLKYGVDALQALRDLAVDGLNGAELTKNTIALTEIDTDNLNLNASVDRIFTKINELGPLGVQVS